ncbi:BglG family transcription antiterminator [Enterococcus dongliensis]|uniref:BglG family transcription antiterminator n=1 Tax=Enterococcus dongliensis TaxID=2559925 RepID=UPI0028904B01|nr:PTS sugar transporter subunit IIA [Enterococcus dongliensis]MDT2613271.1 PTS sugar transporter subunit IIA [Enterococcus dongliensis]
MNNDYVDSKQRKFLIIKRLLNQEHLSYQQLSEEYYVSRSSIANDISYTKNLFSKEDLALTFDNSGTFFEGTEVQIQRIMKRIVLNQLNNGMPVSLFISEELMEKVSLGFYKALNEKQIEIPESYVQNIVVSIVLIIQRARENHFIQLDGTNQYGKFFLEFDKYPLVYGLLNELQEKDIYHFSQDEIQYLTYLIVGSGLRFFMKDKAIPFAFRGKVRFLIQKVSEGLQTDLTQDGRLEEDLVVHLYQLILRLEAQSSVVNPLIEEIKQTYPALYGVVWFALADFCKPYQIALSDDEVGFVSIHFQAAVERVKKMHKILFVCPNGIGTSSFISAKIRRILPDVNSIETATISTLKEMDLSDVDFIISTVEVPDIEKTVVQISPMVTVKDMKRIMNHYIDLIIAREQKKLPKSEMANETKNFIAKNILFQNFSTKEAALKFLLDQQTFLNEELREQFESSVWERERLQSTYLDNGFAIPHGSPEFVEETTITILILDKPINWGNQKVDIIVLLMIKEEDTRKVESVMELVMQGIEDKNWFISKMMEVRE